MSNGVKPNYFTCTLGQALIINQGEAQISNINDFIEHQASTVAEHPAVGFANIGQDKSACQRYSFRDVARGSIFVSQLAVKDIKNTTTQGQTTVALLCPSTPEFLFAWLGLMRLGHAVLLIAPQCQPSAIAHLCQTCDVGTLFFDDSYQELATSSSKAAQSEKDHKLECVPLMFSTTSKAFADALQSQPESITSPKLDDTAIGYLHHTSGTSTGLPKPIPQSHRAGLGVLPRFKDGTDKATFTTTPLYHGGVADLFRAWASNAMIWLFPGKGTPITAKNIVSCLDVACVEHERGQTPAVKYFSSVPYVLQMMAADSRGLSYLQKMDIVGVGGAALPAKAGDDLVEKGVNLISRFGSAECGFLMSSHRDYKNDKEWSYLRTGAGMDRVNFEEQDGGLAELVVLHGWPHKAKTNREDGSFATSDLFLPHASIPNAWKYHSRSDSQLTLITGKKFDPAPQEAAIAHSNLLDDVLIFGNGQPFPGALLFRSETAKDMPENELISILAPLIEKLNRESQGHARIARNMLVVIDHGENHLEKSSKGTILRNKAEETYASEIESAYSGLTASLSDSVSDEEVPKLIKEKIEGIVSKGTIDTEDDLHAYGVDSVASIQIRYTLRQLLPADATEPPLSIVEDCGTVSKLSEYVLSRRKGEDYSGTNDLDELALMRELVDKYGNFQDLPDMPHMSTELEKSASASAGEKEAGEVVLLTGTTGALGAHLLHLYRLDAKVSHIYCLVRGATPQAASERVSKSLSSRGLPSLSSSSIGKTKVTILPCSLSDNSLGLSTSSYAKLAAQVTTIVHCAWSVNFRLRLHSFVKDHIAGLRHLVLFSLVAGKTQGQQPNLGFCSSVASVATLVSSDTAGGIEEEASGKPQDASSLGYSRSKWVAEAMLHQLTTQIPSTASKTAIFRVGQLSGDTARGVWNAKEAWPLMLASVRATSCLPDLGVEPLGWLPVDTAAKGIVEITASLDATKDVGTTNGAKEEAASIYYHVLNAAATPTWQDLLTWAQANSGTDFTLLPPRDWIRRMEDLQKEQPDYPALALLGLWRNAYAGDDRDEGHREAAESFSERSAGGEMELEESKRGKSAPKRPFQTKRAESQAESLKGMKVLDEVYFDRVWKWIMKEVAEGSK